MGFGRAVFLSRDRPGPRVFRVAGKRPLDLAELEGGSIEADLARRDFTANAVALALPGGQLLDPFGGIADIANGPPLLRSAPMTTTSKASFTVCF